MKATIDIPDELYRRVKAKSVEEGRKIREVTIELFQAWLAGGNAWRSEAEQQRLRARMMKQVGRFDSGVDDLGSNPKPFEGLGDDAVDHR
ncbi:MAG TPA: hypothetical protein VMN36_03830 [Verrucomicrobiales bacterium]|nr:hypothetical protein [Verrucomicrobiales bacterium]